MPEAQGPHAPARLGALQGLRALAAFLVVLDHAALGYWRQLEPGRTDVSSAWFVGALGVKCFFAISGFIIHRATLHAPRGPQGALGFLQRRLIRILPLYALATLAYGGLLAFRGHPPSLAMWLQSLAFIPYPNEAGLMRPILSVGWSLNFEMFFYVLVALSLCLPRRFSPWSVIGALLALMAAGPAFAGTRLALLIDPMLLFFLAGMGVAQLAGPSKAGALSWGVAWLLGSAPLLGLCLAVATGALPVATADGLALPACALALWCCAREASPGPAPPASWLRRVLVRAGDASYSTYLVHTFLMGAFLAAFLAVARPAASSTALLLGHAALAGVAATLCGLALHAWVEAPLLRLLKARFATR